MALTYKLIDNHFHYYLGDEELGFIETYENKAHQDNLYVSLALNTYEPEYASEIFDLIQVHTNSSLQIGLNSSDKEAIDFLVEAGFVLKRNTFMMEVSKANLKQPLSDSNDDIKLITAEENTDLFLEALSMLYTQYEEDHSSVNALHLDLEEFRESTPDTVYVELDSEGRVKRYAFVEAEEIAYIGPDLDEQDQFVFDLLAVLFAEYKTLEFEADDTSPAHTKLKKYFNYGVDSIYKTYVLDK